MFSISRFLPRGSDESMSPSNMVIGLVPPMVICECWACLSNMVVDVFLPWLDVSARRAFLTGSDISVEEDEDLHGG